MMIDSMRYSDEGAYVTQPSYILRIFYLDLEHSCTELDPK